MHPTEARGEKDFELWLPFSRREKGLGDEGGNLATVGCPRLRLLLSKKLLLN
jgi:hypothetical protein